MRLRWKYAVTIGLCAVLIMGGLWFLDARRERAQLISLFSTSITIQARAIRDIFEVSGDPNRVQAVIMAAIGTGVVDVLRVVDRRSVVLASSRRDEIGKIFNMPVVFGGAILSDGAKPYYMKEMTGVLEIGETKAIVAIVPYAAHVKSPYAETETGIIGGVVFASANLERLKGYIGKTSGERIIYMVVVTIFFSTLVMWVTSRAVIRPIGDLIRAIEIAEGGDLSATANIRTGDELEELGEKFNKMLRAIELANEKLRRFNEELERKVAEANADLIEANDRLKESLREVATIKEQLDNILSSIADGVFTVDSNGIITTFNRAATMITGYEAHEAIGRDCRSLFDRPDCGELCQGVHEMEAGLTIETSLRRKDGAVIPVEVSISPLRDSEGRVVGLVEAFRDISELKRMREEVELKERLAALGNMAAGLAHEIRNPLNSLALTAQYMEQLFPPKTEEDKAEFLECLGIIKRKMEELNESVEDFLQFARPPQMSFSKVELSKVLEDVIFLISMDARGRGIEVEEEVEDGLPEIIGDPKQIQKAFLNIALNAIQAMPNGGTLGIRAWAEGKWVVVEISDTGIGMDRETMEHLFDPYFTRRKGGTGLGLTISYTIVERHGGKILVDSEKGKGTKVKIVLPTDRGLGG
jgi:PAS domain S-box-containing protein